MKIDLSQKSTKTGLALVGSAVVGLAMGNTELATVTVGESGFQVSGLVPTVAAILVGIWDSLRNEKK